MAVAQGYGKTVTSGSVFAYDVADTRNSYRGEPTVNAIPNADTMASWTTYYRTIALSTFTTEFGTTGYRFVNQPSWNGIYRNFNLGSTGFYTFSAWFRYNGGSTDNNGATVYISNYGSGDTAAALDKSKVGIWQRVSFTVNVTSPSNVYFFLISFGGVDNGTGNPDFSSWEVTMPQIELKSHATPFVNGTRSATQGLLPLVGNTSLDLSGTSFNSNAQIAFDGTDDYITIGNFTNKPTTAITCEAIIKPTKPSVGTGTIRGGAISSGNSMYLGIIDSTDGGNTFSMHWANQTNSSRVYNWNGQIPNNQYSHLIGTYDGATARAYLNGVEIWSTSQSGTIPDATYYIATYGGTIVDGTHNFNGEIPIARIYNRALSAGEVRQNYLHYKTRFNLS
jgi:hypothetical protein